MLLFLKSVGKFLLSLVGGSAKRVNYNLNGFTEIYFIYLFINSCFPCLRYMNAYVQNVRIYM